MNNIFQKYGWIIWVVVFIILMYQTISSGKDLSVFAATGLIIGYLRWIHKRNL